MAYRTVELFAGCGGMALGLEMAGFETEMLVEFDKHAAATLRKNRPNWNIIEDDVRNVSFKGIQADVVAGGFPCQTFSHAGRREGFGDTRGTLFHELARAVEEIKPKIVIGENVTGLLKHDGGRTLDTILHVFEDMGYHLAVKVLDASWYDVPQTRKRLIIVGVQEDMTFWWPRESSRRITLGEALEGCPPSEGVKYSPERKAVLDLVPAGGYWTSLPEPLRTEYMAGFQASVDRVGKRYGLVGVARRLSFDKPSPTVLTHPSQKMTEFCHPTETRPLSVREYARIQTFPDEWKFEGPVSAQYKQIGNAVPVNLGKHIGLAVKDSLEEYAEAHKC